MSQYQHTTSRASGSHSETRVRAAEVGKDNTNEANANVDSPCPIRSVHGSTPGFYVGVPGMAVSGDSKRKLGEIGPERLPSTKKSSITGKESHKKESEPNTAEKYKYLLRYQLRDECLSRSLPAGGSIQDLENRLRFYDAARTQDSTSQGSVKESNDLYTPSIEEQSDRYTPMSTKELKKECGKRSLPVSYAKADLRRCLRLYDAARALGLTPEESLEARKATFQRYQAFEARSVTPREHKEEDGISAASEEVAEGHALGDASQESVMDEGQKPTFLESSELSSPPSIRSQASSELETYATTAQDSIQDRDISDKCSRQAAKPSYTAMSVNQMRSLCRSRSLRHYGVLSSELRKTLIAYDKQLAKQVNNTEVEVGSNHGITEPEVVPSVSPPSVGLFDSSSSLQDGETPDPQTRLMGASAVYMQSRPVLKHLKDIGTDSSPRKTPYAEYPLSLQQPLVSLLNLAIKNTRRDSGESSSQYTQKITKSLSEHATKVAEKEMFNARYATESPYWVCCCGIPSYEIRQKQFASFSGNCFYHVSLLAQRGIFTMKEYQEYLVAQQALDQTQSCLCQKPAVDHPEHQVIMTQGGFILAQIWREQLIRRYSFHTFRPDMATNRRQGILEVMHNVLEDFMIELSSRQQKRPLVLWARIEAMAWFINTLPTSDEWHYFQDWKRPRQYIMLFGIALLTTINALLQQNLFKDNEPEVPNVGLVLALFIQSTWDSPSNTLNSSDGKDAYQPPFNNNISMNNENGWAAEVVRLAEGHGVRINGVKGIDWTVDQWRRRKTSFESIGRQAMETRNAILHEREPTPASGATLASLAAGEGGTPVRRTGRRVAWRPEDDYDEKGRRLWKKWFFLREFEIYTKEYERDNEPRLTSRVD